MFWCETQSASLKAEQDFKRMALELRINVCCKKFELRINSCYKESQMIIEGVRNCM